MSGVAKVSPGPTACRFGIFCLDLCDRELQRKGVPVKIQEKPLQVLEVLVLNAGQLVSRDELRRKLWPAGIFIEFDDGLNTAVKKLRAALGDSAESPSFIETVPRRGWRFIAPVEIISADAAADLTGDDPRSQLLALVRSTGKIAPRPSVRRWGAAVMGALAPLLIALVLWHFAPRPVEPHATGYVQLTHSGLVHSNQRLLTDGPRLYFIEREGGHWVAKWMLSSGGPATALQLPFSQYDLQDISPEGGELIVRELRTYEIKDLLLWITSTAGGAPRLLHAGAEAAAFSPDGRSVLYANGSAVFRSDRDGSNARKVLDAPGEVVSLSPFGRVMRLGIRGSATAGVSFWETDLDGSHLHRLLSGWHAAQPRWGGSWSPDGRWFVFAAGRDDRRDLWLLPSKPGARPVQLTDGPLDYVTPVFSRDGKRIFAVGVLRRGEMLRYDQVSGQFAPMLGGISADQLEYSRDRQWILYVTYPEGVLWRARADGTQRRQLTSPPMRVFGAHWSPDGSQILFEAQAAPGAESRLRLMPSDGGTSDGGTSEELPFLGSHGGATWLPDGRSIVVGDASAGHLSRLDLRQRTLSEVPGSHGLLGPSVSPSGHYLAATSQPGEALVVIDLHDHTRRQLALGAQYPVWSPDERFIYFNSFAGSAPAMYRVRIADGRIETIFKLGEFAATGSWGYWSTLAPDGAVLLTRDTGSTDVYAISWQAQ